MKKAPLILSFLFFTFFLTAQTSFERHYGTPSNFDEVAGMAFAADGSYLVAGTTANFGAGGYDMLFEKVDADGNTLWQQTWGGEGDDSAASIITVSSGGFLAAGYTGGQNDDQDAAIVRLDEAGAEMWQTTTGDSFDDEAVCALELPDGGFLIVGYTVPEQSLSREILVVRTDSEGNILWEKYLAALGNQNFLGCALAVDGGFFVLKGPYYLYKLDAQGNETGLVELTSEDGGSLLDVRCFERSYDGRLRLGGQVISGGIPFLGEMEEDGELSVQYEFFDNAPFGVVSSFALTPGGNIWVILTAQFGVDVLNDFLLLLDPSSGGEVLLARTPLELGIPDIRFNSLVYALPNDESCIVAGNTLSEALGFNGRLLHLDANAAEEWRKTIGVEEVYDRESGRMIVEAADGGYLIGGTTATATQGRDLWLIRTNPSGQVLWTSQLGGPENEFIAALATMSDGGFVVAGYRRDTLVVSRVDASGGPVWYREFSVGLGDGTFGMTSTALDDILVTMPATSQTESFGQLIKINAQGDSLWTQQYQPGGSFNATYGITASADGGFFLCGCTENQDQNIVPLLIKTDTDGNLLWQNIYPGDGFFSCPITVRQHSGGDLYLNGVNIENGIRPFVLKSTSDGDAIWQQSLVLAPNESTYFTWFSDLKDETEQQFLFGRKSFFNAIQSGGNQAGAITAVNADGSVEWEMDYGIEMGGLFQGGVSTSDGGLAAVGTATFDNSGDAWLVKTESDGTVGFFNPLRPPFELQLSPNPAEVWLNISASGLSSGKAQVSVFNADGQQLHSAMLSTSGESMQHGIRVDHLPGGAYFLQIRQGQKAVTQKWIKK